jgi:hypothetical protein
MVCPDRRFLMLKMFLDDSGTHRASPVVGVGGLIGNDAQWEQFDADWKAVLARPYPEAEPLKKWSSGDCMRGDGEFDSYGDAEKDLVTRRFRDVITNSGVFSASNMIDRVAWDEIITPRFGDKLASAEATALFALIDRIAPWARMQADGSQVAVYYDMGRKSNPWVQHLAGLLQNAATTLPGIASFEFLKVAEATPLQGADMIATESFWYAQDFLSGTTEPTRAHFRAYLEENFHKGNGMILNRDGVEKDAARRNPDGTIKDEKVLRAWNARLNRS